MQCSYRSWAPVNIHIKHQCDPARVLLYWSWCGDAFLLSTVLQSGYLTCRSLTVHSSAHKTGNFFFWPPYCINSSVMCENHQRSASWNLHPQHAGSHRDVSLILMSDVNIQVWSSWPVWLADWITAQVFLLKWPDWAFFFFFFKATFLSLSFLYLHYIYNL